MLNHLQSIAKENCYQLLEFPDTDPAQYISNHPGIERRSRWYRVDVSYPETQLVYSKFTRRIQPSISSLSNEIQAYLRFDTACRLNSTATFEKLALIFNMRSHFRNASEPYIPTSHFPWVIHFAPLQAYFLPSWMCWICACRHTQSDHLSDTKL